MSSFGMPGIGGSLGTCALCGECFAAECMLGESVPSFKLTGHDTQLFGHRKCLNDFQGKTMLDLPEKSPLRQLYEKQQAESLPSGSNT